MILITIVAPLHLITLVSGYTDNSGSLTEIPLNLPSDTTSLDLASNLIPNITVLGDYAASLTDLNLANNLISEITPGVFINCSSLQKLDLTGNYISLLLNDTFQGLISLETLVLDKGKTPMFTEKAAFRGLISLTKLMEEKLTLKSPPCLGPYVPNLQQYNAYASKSTETLTLTDECFMGLNQLTKFDMYNNKNTKPSFNEYKFPETISNIQMAWVRAGNYGMSLVDAVHLSSLNLRSNRLQDFPLLGFITTEVEIIIENNNIACVGLGDLQRIKYAKALQLQNNRLELFPDHDRNCTNAPIQNTEPDQTPEVFIKKIWLTNNRITAFPAGFRSPTLRDLKLRNNRITYLNSSMLIPFPALTKLDVSNNLLVSVQIKHQLLSIEHLILAGNDLTDAGLELITPETLPSLTILELSSNPLTSIPDLSLVTSMSGVIKQEVNLDISQNPLECDGRLCWMWKMTIHGTDDVTCVSPLQLVGRLLHNVTQEELDCFSGKQPELFFEPDIREQYFFWLQTKICHVLMLGY